MLLTWQKSTFQENEGLSSELYWFQTIYFLNCAKLQRRAENGVEHKPIVFALFLQNEKSATRHLCKLLIFHVDQPGLEPGTSRL